jgi:hypothetical protein
MREMEQSTVQVQQEMRNNIQEELQKLKESCNSLEAVAHHAYLVAKGTGLPQPRK